MKNIFPIFVILIITLTGCVTAKEPQESPMWEVNPLNYLNDKQTINGSRTIAEADQPKTRLITYDANIDLTIKESTDSIKTVLNEIAKKYDGYMSKSNNYSTTIEVKSTMLDTAIAEISALGEITSKNIIGNDVTDQYTDLEIRLENAQSARKRYLELLAQAENVSAALMVEKELERLNTQIDLLEGQMRSITQNVQYSSITVYLNEKVKPGILGYIGIGIYEGVKWLFVRG
ncbi:MAG: DUF4349 domain-containing protein [Chitinophagales bacterium]|nr:DUF4349 domain-containing protein [Bacteroidota bacterium]